eukprot:s1792_g1.t1
MRLECRDHTAIRSGGGSWDCLRRARIPWRRPSVSARGPAPSSPIAYRDFGGIQGGLGTLRVAARRLLPTESPAEEHPFTQEAYDRWSRTAAAIEQAASAAKDKRPNPLATSAAVRFIAGLAEEDLCTKQQQLLVWLVRLLETSVYVEQQEEDFAEAIPRSPGRDTQLPYYVGSQWLEARLLQLRKNMVYMAEVLRRAQRFENIRASEGSIDGSVVSLVKRLASSTFAFGIDETLKLLKLVEAAKDLLRELAVELVGGPGHHQPVLVQYS